MSDRLRVYFYRFALYTSLEIPPEFLHQIVSPVINLQNLFSGFLIVATRKSQNTEECHYSIYKFYSSHVLGMRYLKLLGIFLFAAAVHKNEQQQDDNENDGRQRAKLRCKSSFTGIRINIRWTAFPVPRYQL